MVSDLSYALPDQSGHLVALTPIFGRDQEIAAVLELIQRPESRLVTLTGPGGIGKTRLALEVAATLGNTFPDGVVLAPLASVRDPGLVLTTIGQCVGVREGPGSSIQNGLRQTLREKRLLLILDNLEHLIAAAQDISWLLGTAPNLTILVTSRAPLQVRGEQEFEVRPLPIPDGTDRTQTSTNPAVLLFAERARSIDSAFVLNQTNTAAVAEICRRLDGLPLAIELAAARSKILPPAALVARMSRSLPLLTAGPRDLPDRLRTMRNAIAWSYDLLDSNQQQLFARLSVFVGAFTLLEAEAIAPNRVDLLDGLDGLIGNSLLRQVERESEPRFQMLETLREFGLERLDVSDEATNARSNHADHFLALAEAAATYLGGAERTPWLERLDAAQGNFRVALTWYIEQAATRQALRLAGSLWQFWWWRSHLAEGRRWLEQTLELPGADVWPAERAAVLTGIGALAETQGDYEAAGRHHEQAVAIWQEIGDRHGLAVSLLFRWLVSFNADDQEGMVALSSESLRLFQELNDPWGIAMSLMEQGVMAMRRQDDGPAMTLLDEAITRFREINDAWGVAVCKGVLGNVATNRKEYGESAALTSASLTTLLQLNDLWGVATVLPAAARLAAERGKWVQAVRISGAVARLHETIGGPLKVPFRQRYEQTLSLALAELGESKFNEAWAAGQGLSPEAAVAEAVNPDSEESVSGTVGGLAAPLSPREREVMRLVPTCSARQIGEQLFISESTVRTHIDNILNKVGARNQKELIAFAYERGLVAGSKP